MFTQPALSDFIIQTLYFDCSDLDPQESAFVPQTLPSITHFAVCILFQLWFQRKAGGLVFFKLFFVMLNKGACGLDLFTASVGHERAL